MRRELGIDYVELPASDLAAVRRFYETAFGWTFTEYGDDYLALSDGERDGGFFRSELKSTTATGGALILLYSKDLEKTRDKVLEAGGALGQEIFSFPGGRRFHFFDPSGNELGVWSDK